MAGAVRSAIILAAGMGSRLAARGTQTPKGLLRFGELPIVEESLLKLAAAGIEQVVIATGHLSEQYDELASRHSARVTCVHNPSYAESGSMYSLWCAREQLERDFLLLESDLIYERRALSALLEDERPDLVLLSGPTGAGDEVFVETDSGQLVAMSKDRTALHGPVAGELVGITKVSRDLFDVMCEYAVDRFRETLRVDYETNALVVAADRRPVPCLLVDGLLWAEIDDARHLRRATTEIYPRIRASEG
jgi:2-aminoethylphosphonate-pyruvate transaminase